MNAKERQLRGAEVQRMIKEWISPACYSSVLSIAHDIILGDKQDRLSSEKIVNQAIASARKKGLFE